MDDNRRCIGEQAASCRASPSFDGSNASRGKGWATRINASAALARINSPKSRDALETAARNRGWTPSEGALWDWLRVVLAEPKAVKWPDPAPPEPKGEKAKGK